MSRIIGSSWLMKTNKKCHFNNISGAKDQVNFKVKHFNSVRKWVNSVVINQSNLFFHSCFHTLCGHSLTDYSYFKPILLLHSKEAAFCRRRCTCTDVAPTNILTDDFDIFGPSSIYWHIFLYFHVCNTSTTSGKTQFCLSTSNFHSKMLFLSTIELDNIKKSNMTILFSQ